MVCSFSHLNFWRRGGDYSAPFFATLFVSVTAHHKIRVFCRLLPSLSSRMRLSNALQSLLWTSKVPKKGNISNKPGFFFSCLLWAIAVCQHRPGRVCSETAFDMQRLLQVHALRQVEDRRAFPTRRSPRRKNVLPHLFDSLLIFPIAKSWVHGEIDLAKFNGVGSNSLEHL